MALALTMITDNLLGHVPGAARRSDDRPKLAPGWLWFWEEEQSRVAVCPRHYGAEEIRERAASHSDAGQRRGIGAGMPCSRFGT